MPLLLRSTRALALAAALLAFSAVRADAQSLAAECEYAPNGPSHVVVGAVECLRFDSAMMGGVVPLTYYVPHACDPALGRRWWAGAGEGAFTSFGDAKRRISVSGVDDLASASLSFSDLTGWGDRRSRFLDLTDEVWRVRAYGDFWSHCLVAEGAVDIAVEPEVKLWDLAPLDILVREAGGRFTNLAAEPGPHGGSAVATNGLLHDAVLARLASA